MCLIAFCSFSPEQQARHGLALVLLANRDEAYSRPSLPAHWWRTGETAADVWCYGGRDQVAGGSWLAITPTGRWAAVTNVREGIKGPQNPPLPSRGHLLTRALAGEPVPAVALHPGFNLLVGNSGSVNLYSNRGPQSPGVQYQQLAHGVHAVSNGVMLNDWPKAQTLKHALTTRLAQQPHEPVRWQTEASKLSANLLELLADEVPPRDDQLPDTGVGIEAERLLSPVLIRSEHYGTRVSSVIVISSSAEVWFTEQSRHGPSQFRQANFRIQS